MQKMSKMEMATFAAGDLFGGGAQLVIGFFYLRFLTDVVRINPILAGTVILLYHHHHMEFVRYGNRTGLEILMEETNPEWVSLMMDTYWTQKGGRNPVEQIRQFSDRIKIMHLRDYKVTGSWRKGGYAVTDSALFQGNLDMAAITRAAIEANIVYLPVEQQTDKPFEDLSLSMEGLKNHGFESITGL